MVDLRDFGDPVEHYAVKVRSIAVNGRPLRLGDGRTVYALIDTGVTGCVVDRELFNKRYIDARLGKEKGLWRNVEITFASRKGERLSVQAANPITTPVSELPWGNFKGHIIVIGLEFLKKSILTIDIDRRRAWIA